MKNTNFQEENSGAPRGAGAEQLGANKKEPLHIRQVGRAGWQEAHTYYKVSRVLNAAPRKGQSGALRGRIGSIAPAPFSQQRSPLPQQHSFLQPPRQWSSVPGRASPHAPRRLFCRTQRRFTCGHAAPRLLSSHLFRAVQWALYTYTHNKRARFLTCASLFCETLLLED